MLWTCTLVARLSGVVVLFRPPCLAHCSKGKRPSPSNTKGLVCSPTHHAACDSVGKTCGNAAEKGVSTTPRMSCSSRSIFIDMSSGLS